MEPFTEKVFKEISANYEWNRSISEPDLCDPFKKLNRFIIKHPHEYIAVDDLKYFRRKKPPDQRIRSNICLYDINQTVLPVGALNTEYRSSFHDLDLGLRPHLLRRSTSLRLEGLMHHLSESREQFHWYNPKDLLSCRGYPIKNPENLRVGGHLNMDAEYRSAYISYPMVDRTMKILPREMFRIEPDPPQIIQSREINQSPEEVAAIKKLTDDKFKRDLAAKEHHKCHLQQRAADINYNTMPSEYKRQFKQYPIEKAHSIPQISHIKIQGEFRGLPEYQESFKMYSNYLKSEPIKKVDNLIMSGAEATTHTINVTASEIPEYREQFCDPPKDISKERSKKTDDHLYPQGEFSKVLPEYYESFRDPQVKSIPERGKCREPYLSLKGQIEFNPEYRNTYLDFPRSRPIVRKPVSTFRLPTSTSAATSNTRMDSKSPKHSPRQFYKSSSPQRLPCNYEPPTANKTSTTTTVTTDVTTTPEYRRALTHYQLRERTPTRKQHFYETDGGGNSKHIPMPNLMMKSDRKSSDSSFDFTNSVMPATGGIAHKRRTLRHRQGLILNNQTVSAQSSFENVSHSSKKPPKFGRRASVLQNAVNCRKNSSIIEGNPKYTSQRRKDSVCESINRDSFVVLKEPCKKSSWMKKSWFES